MLYGHIETDEERVDHLIQLRELQDETGHFLTMTPLSFHPENTELEDIEGPTCDDDLRNIHLDRCRHVVRIPTDTAYPSFNLAQSVLVGVSCIGLVWAAVVRVQNPAPVEHGWVGLGVMGVASAATWALVRFQQQVIARTGSSAIAADSLHYRGDLLMNGAVALSLIATGTLGWTLLDPLLGLVVAAIVGHSAWQIGWQAVQNLMDREFPDEQRQRIRQLVLAHPEVRGVHDLRTRQSGLQPFIQFHLELDGEMTLHAAHRITEQVERDIQAAFPGAEVMVHADPDSEPAEGLQG